MLLTSFRAASMASLRSFRSKGLRKKRVTLRAAALATLSLNALAEIMTTGILENRGRARRRAINSNPSMLGINTSQTMMSGYGGFSIKRNAA